MVEWIALAVSIAAFAVSIVALVQGRRIVRIDRRLRDSPFTGEVKD